MARRLRRARFSHLRDFHREKISGDACARRRGEPMLWPWRESDCPLCGGTGWRLVERVDANEKAERVVERANAKPGVSSAAPKLTWAVPCDCTGGDQRTRALARAHIPRRYEHCDFENFDTDLWDKKAAEAPAWNRSLAQARLVVDRSPGTIPPPAKPASC